jgi:hypothetical protein
MSETLWMPIGLGIVIIVLGSFALGTNWNVRKGHQVLQWLTDGLPLIGERTTYRWLGSSVVELKIAKANAPFRNAETLVIFEPRDIVLLWWWSRLQNRRDMMIFRAQLTAAPGFEIEVFDPKGWTTFRTERDVKGKNWAKLDLPALPALLAYHSSKAETEMIQRLIALANRLGGDLIRLSVRRDVPNLEIHWRLPNQKTQSAKEMLARLQQMAGEILHG